ncbi:glutamate synthase large subunit [Pedosphaera parvula]|uniref:Glutamate synthase [NADPH] large chain n=1 Tax=Pedosphaera parvula (strain Ellin514) TaxID=320771 RepID=B9XFF2_PEDPL|nr:glutamate synthase large subunit [Pedosphaera parvula]EEF61316.1 Glutamate synthase (ferredoxin) [Pedosphaera parvula Ellin514]
MDNQNHIDSHITTIGLPQKQGLYDPQFEHDACGVGFVVNIKGKKSHEIIRQAIQVLLNLDHRGACGCEANTGDGAGILIQTPHGFLKAVCAKEGIDLPEPGQYGVGLLYLPPIDGERKECEQIFGKIVAEEGQRIIGWRDVPVDNSSLGNTAKSSEPLMRHVFIKRDPKIKDDMAFERKLYVIRKRATNEIRRAGFPGSNYWYTASLSYKTLVYKGMLNTEQVDKYFLDLRDPAMDSALALVHSRFSTNTFPSWERGHPYRYVAHNGEINTLRGNINWMHARQSMFESELFGQDLKKILPIINTDGSDSAMFDNCLELLVMAGRSLPHAIMMMIPEPWANHETMSDERKAFYEYHSCLMEPWDGPASIAFTDGKMIGAILDRNGLRPSRYYVTKDDLVVMASEVGVLDIAPERILQKGRLQPGRMFLIDMEQGRIVADEEIKDKVAKQHPYRQWLNKYMVEMANLPGVTHLPEPSHETVLRRQQAFGYTFEDLRILMVPMARDGVEAVGSMGTDTPLAVLSDKPQPLYNYFKQLFAQVTNPPIDCIREEIVTSAETTIGSERNLLKPIPESCHLIELKSPILTNEEFAKLKHVDHEGFKSVTIPILYRINEGEKGLERAMGDLYAKADRAINDGVNILILSDRGIDRENAAVPALLAVSGLHHHLIRQGTRTRVGLVLESGEPREVHHFSLLIGYGAGAINPYLAFETLDDMIRQGLLKNITHKDACKNFAKAAVKGVVKVISKMGISTIQSYRGAQIFEAVGLKKSVVDKYFTWTPTRIEGVGMDVIATEVQMRHQHAFPERQTNGHTLEVGGNYQWRAEGEVHLFSPQTVHKLQQAVRANSYNAFKEYSALVNDQTRKHCTLRGLLDLKLAANPISIEEVESVESILKRFKTGAMSYGSISKEAHESLAIAMNRIGGKSNTGEGGEDSARYIPDANGDSRNSAIKQVASGRFGVTSLYLVNAKEIQIKMAQGAKPGEGGQLPGGKVYPWVAKVRHATPGVGLISPPPHHDIYSIEDLAELIHDLKNSNTRARVSVKLVSEVGVGTVAAGVAKAHADVVLISGFDGGTGASPQTSIKHAGIPWELGLAETHQTLLLNNLRSRIVVETDGQLKTGRDVIVAALLGAEEFGFATAPLVALGCIMMRVCHLNTCPVGVATQDPELRKNFTGDPAHAVNFMRFIAQEVRELMAQLGFRTVNEMVGRTDLLEPKKAIEHWKAKGLDLSNMLYQPKVGSDVGRYAQMVQDHGLDKALDNTTLLKLCAPALERKEKVVADLPIRNVNRVVGTILGSEVTRRYGVEALPEDTIQLNFKGSAGQSLGAFVPKGVTLRLEGDANDYVGKGLSGGKIIVYPPKGSTFNPAENIIIGNVALYGATSGEVYIGGMAGERFCVRNSGVNAVVEAVGDHGCEYMTGGRVVVLGPTGRNFAAGMSGGVAYVLDETGDFKSRCNQQMVGLEKLEDATEIEELQQMIKRHADYTRSQHAFKILALWDETVPKFVKVMPKDYKRMLQSIKRVTEAGLSGEEALMAAFNDNAKDASRVGGG